MATHVRESIRDAIVTKCTGLTTSGSRVYASRAYPIDSTNLPGLLIKTGKEEIDQEAGRVARVQERTLEIIIEAYDKLISGLDDKLDTMVAEVETALLPSGISAGSTIDLFEISEPEFVDGSDQPVGRLKMIFGVRYLTADGAPTVEL